MTDTFPYRTRPPTGGGKFRLRQSKFGDGYSQDSLDGLNTDEQAWTAVTSGTASQMQAVLDWIRAHAGQSFYWTPPLGVQGVYKCKEYKHQELGGNYFVVTLEFEQGFLP